MSEARKKNIVVVGAGIIGASIAWHLASSGARVTVIAQGSAGGVATPNTFAWINASWGNPEPYFRLRARAMAEWARLATDVPSVPLSFCGGLLWDLRPAELEAYAAEHSSWGYDIRRVYRDEIARIEPKLVERPDLAVYAAGEGVAEPVATTLALLADARSRGTRVVTGAAVKTLKMKDGRVTGVETADGIFEADEVVIAAGAGSVAIAATAGIDLPVETPPGLIVHSNPHAKLLNGLVLAERLHMRQTTEGRVIAGSDFGGADPGENAEATARDLFGATKAMLRASDGLQLDFHTVGYRPTPKDGFPIIGRAHGLDGLYIAVMHSGITLAPAVGLFAAQEVADGRDEPLLAPYRLARFTA